MAELTAISILTFIAVILLVGLLSSMIARKLKISEILLLLVIGMALGYVKYQGKPLIQFPVLFLTSMSILALAMIIFDASSRLKLREFDSFSMRAFKLAGVYLVFNFILLSTATHFLFNLSWGLSIVFGLLMSGTSPEVMLSMLGSSKNKAVEILKLESIINTPLTVLLPFIAIDIIRRVSPSEGFSSTVISQLAPNTVQGDEEKVFSYLFTARSPDCSIADIRLGRELGRKRSACCDNTRSFLRKPCIEEKQRKKRALGI
jgi:NhaP-type Na+/H+ or K+/H+ antiporter